MSTFCKVDIFFRNQDFETLLFVEHDIYIYVHKCILLRYSIIETEDIVTWMIHLEGVKPQYAVILPDVHAEAIITYPFNVRCEA